MAVDPYAPCPCGSGKKLKFCCKDLAGDIEKVHHLIQGEQPHAALKHIHHLMEKAPQREALMDLRAMLELSLHEFEAAGKTIDAFLAAHTRNASAHAHQAILTSVKKSGTASIPALQNSLELLDNDMHCSCRENCLRPADICCSMRGSLRRTTIAVWNC